MEYNRQLGPPPPKRIKKTIAKIPQLPTDVVAAVLVRLPADVLQRFRCVCKSWDSLITQDQFFIAQHLTTPSKLKKSGFVSLSTKQLAFDDYMLNHTSGPKIHKINFSLVPQRYELTNSCNGLVGVYGRDSIFIANPSIMKLAVLPRCSPHNGSRYATPAVAIGFEPSAAEYKVVRLFAREYKGSELVSFGCEVFSLGGKEFRRSWKWIEDPPVLGDMENYFPFVVNGAIHWTIAFEFVVSSRRSSGFMGPEVALSFNLREEKFSIVLHPKGSSRPKHSYVVALGGSLCIVDAPCSRQMYIWMLKDHAKSKWVKQYSIDFSKIYRWRRISTDLVMPMTLEDGKIAFYYHEDRNGGRILYYNPSTMSFMECEKLINNNNAFIRFAAPYTGSVVWPWPRFCH